jgi:hypothetical protein
LSTPQRDRVKAIGKQSLLLGKLANFQSVKWKDMMARKQESTIEELTDAEIRSAVRNLDSNPSCHIRGKSTVPFS